MGAGGCFFGRRVGWTGASPNKPLYVEDPEDADVQVFVFPASVVNCMLVSWWSNKLTPPGALMGHGRHGPIAASPAEVEREQGNGRTPSGWLP